MLPRLGVFLTILLASTIAAAGEQFRSSVEEVVIGTVDSGPARIAAIPLTAAASEPVATPLRTPDLAWVDARLAAMSLKEKVGQMIMIEYIGSSAATNLRTYGLTGFIFTGNNNTALNLWNAINSMQAQTTVPLFFAIDCEPGLGGRCVDATRFPMNMAMGATRRTDLAEAQGRVTARECRSLGFQIGFGPVVDVNTEPINPIIGIRSYGDDPALVTSLARAHTQAAAQEGMLCTFKHYPGHGDTTGDSHSSLPIVGCPMDELQAMHIQPYRTLIQDRLAELVMSAHNWYYAIDGNVTPWPATLSHVAMTDILRTDLGFKRLVISDSYGMAGITQTTSTYNAARVGVQAGLDIILMPSNLKSAYDGIYDAVMSGQIPESRINESVRRVLGMKSRAGMPEVTTTPRTLWESTLKHPDHLAVARDVAAAAVRAVRVNPADLLNTSSNVYLINLDTSTQIFYRYPPATLISALTDKGCSVYTKTVSSTIGSSSRAAIVSESAAYSHVVIVSTYWKPQLPGDQPTLVQDLINAGRKIIYVSLGSPYHILQFPTMQNYFCAFSSHFESQNELARILMQETPVPGGGWPVTVPGVVDARVEDWQRQ